jgi:hypothetical protein
MDLISHAGLVNLCGRLLDETLRVDKSPVTYEDWLQFATFRLEECAYRWPTMQKMVDTLGGTTSDIANMRALLYRRFLSNSQGVPSLTLGDNEKRLCRFLVAEGALLFDQNSALYSVRLS